MGAKSVVLVSEGTLHMYGVYFSFELSQDSYKVSSVYTCWYEPTQSEPKWHHCELNTTAIGTCPGCIALQNYCLTPHYYDHSVTIATLNTQHSDCHRRLIIAGKSDVSPSGDPRPKLVLVSLSWRSHPMRHVERHPLCLGTSKEIGEA